MAIEFDCSHCGQHLRIKEELAGKQGKCPACGERISVPIPGAATEAADIYDLAPVDDDEERARQRQLAELRAAEEAILVDKTPPAPETATAAPPAAETPQQAAPPRSIAELTRGEQEEAVPAEEIRNEVYRYLRLLSAGDLDRAAEITARLKRAPATAEGVIDQVAMAELVPKALAGIPKAVLLGFLRQLRAELAE